MLLLLMLDLLKVAVGGVGDGCTVLFGWINWAAGSRDGAFGPDNRWTHGCIFKMLPDLILTGFVMVGTGMGSDKTCGGFKMGRFECG